ncbi:MAG: error-prone DNA polymerase [Acidobacteria bacterium RIFCSPLOWO2_12_FULL_68_19]|nr:MAG: error-prone DNA polymerase [Acidobacteria bacterium RIFCSPLOWO2_12_FULL_68_19]
MYIELHCASAFSFLRGASLPEALVERAAALGYPALALLDADGVYGAPRFHEAAQKAGLRAIIGAELTIGSMITDDRDTEAPRTNPRTPSRGLSASVARGGDRWQLPVLVESREGYRNLCRLITRMKLRAAKGEGALELEELEGATAGLVALGGRALLDTRRYGVGGLLDRLVGLFGRGRVYVELQRHRLRDQEADNAALDALARAFRVPVAATNGVRFAQPADRPLFDVLTCVRHRTTVDGAGRRLAQNAERYLKSPEAMAALFADRPEALAGAVALAERLEYTMGDLGYRFPRYPAPAGETEAAFLRHITEAGARERYRPYHDRARAQIARELDLIDKLDLAGYFLIVWDIVNYARQQRILVQGRGSAANSAVCYSLGITAVDPIAMDLLFERFLSEERGEWPDIDLDLPSGDRRERVIQHVYEKYGRLGAAMTAVVITYRSRSAVREVGKALSLEEDEIDRLANVMHHVEFTDPHETLGRTLASAGLSLDGPRMRTFADLWFRMQDLPRHLGQHSGGMVICQGALDAVVPLEPAAMPGRVVVQWDKDDCAGMGIVKVDLLGLGMMAVLQDAIELVNASTPNSQCPTPNAQFDLAHLPPDDPDVYELLRKADTIGVFQVESRAQMATLPRLEPRCFYDIVVQVAIIRPGPIVGDMVHPYLNRRAGREPVVPLHPSLEPVLARTLGVPLFQEQLLRMAMVAAGFTGGQAEELRRAMGFKRSEQRMRQIEVQLREGMAKKGITGETAERIVASITSFALYGFPESHAASFALLAYASAYLKVHYPAAFYTALLNNQPMGFYHPATLVKDAQRRGVRFHPIDVQQSDWLCRIEEDGAIRLGLVYVNGLRMEIGQAIAAFDRTTTCVADGSARSQGRLECPKCGSDDDSMIERVRDRTCFCNTCAHEWTVERRPAWRFASIEDLVRRTGLRRDELTTLADIGALNAFTHERRSALWQVERVIRPAGDLFENEERFEYAPPASPLAPTDAGERLRADYAGTGLTIGPHPMALCRREMALRGVLRACDLPQARDGRRVRVAGMVITRQRPGTAKGFVFLTLEDETGVSNVIIRPDLFDRVRPIVLRQPFLLVEGVLQHQDGVLSIRAERLQGIAGAASVEAHDFS